MFYGLFGMRNNKCFIICVSFSILGDPVPRGPPVEVTLIKDGAGLGFSLEGGKDSPFGDQPLTIKKIFTGKSKNTSNVNVVLYFIIFS